MLDKLKAVNQILDSIGESPVNSLQSGLGDAETAVRILDQAVEDELEKGWNFNTEREWKLTPDTNGFCILPAGTLKADVSGVTNGRRLTIRTDEDGVIKVYDIKNQTFVFTDAIYMDIVLSFAFDELPHAFRKYIALQAAGIYQQSEMGSQTLDAFLTKRIREAWEALLDADAEDEGANVLRDSQSVVDTTYRLNRLRGEGYGR